MHQTSKSTMNNAVCGCGRTCRATGGAQRRAMFGDDVAKQALQLRRAQEAQPALHAQQSTAHSRQHIV